MQTATCGRSGRPARRLQLYTDLQVRHVGFESEGFERLSLNTTAVDDSFFFFNPKLGLRYLQEQREWYFSAGIVNKEPVLIDYYAPKVLAGLEQLRHEQLRNIEAGLTQQWGRTTLGVNFYLMDYHNLLAATGELNDVGFNVRTNVARAYRSGIELTAQTRLHPHLHLSANAALSRNKARKYTELLTDFATGAIVPIHYSDTDLALSPNAVAGWQLQWQPTAALELALLGKYVGRQYLDNTGNSSQQLNAFYVQNARLQLRPSRGFWQHLQASLLLNNLFDAEYEPSGYTFSYLVDGTRYADNSYYPQAGTNFMAEITFTF